MVSIRDRISETVSALAKAIEFKNSHLPPEQRLALRLLQLMPLFRDTKTIHAWDAAIGQILAKSENETDVGVLIVEVYEFGRCTLYAAFNKIEAQRSFERVSQLLQDRGIPVPKVGRLFSL